MKSAEEWWDEYWRSTPIGADAAMKLIRAAQVEALRHAAELCRGRISTIKKPEYNVACDECAVFCEAEAIKLTQGS